jgi:Ser/Thr protein kinase RdoA (MazF antagonist)
MNAEAMASRIAGEFELPGAIATVRAHGGGLINDSFLVTTADGLRVILQRLNTRVFAHPEQVLANLRTLLDHARTRGADGLRLPAIYPARDGRDYVTDPDGGFWRALEFIENTETRERLADTTEAANVGAALARFHALLANLPVARLHETLPGFHVTPGYLARFDAALAAAPDIDGAELRAALAFVEERRAFVPVLEDARQAGKLRLRPIHGDPKLNNFLFEAGSARVVSLIDLDTVQPGLVHYDIGDCLRSCCNPAGEAPADLAEVRFDLELAGAILHGYLTGAARLLTAGDIFYLFDAIRLIPFELGLRFLTDHIEGDRYFKVAARGDNLYRARVQFALTASVEANEHVLRNLMASLTDG